VKAWHPDRFADDRSQQRTAEMKMKAVNVAFQFLTSPSSKKGRPAQPKAATQPAPPQQRAEEKQATSNSRQSPPVGGRSQEGYPKTHTSSKAPPPPGPQTWPNQQTTVPHPQRHPGWNASSGLKTFLSYAAIMCAVGLGRLFWQSIDAKPTTTTVQPQLEQA
jgi:curved DNA-binding protein CbpA